MSHLNIGRLNDEDVSFLCERIDRGLAYHELMALIDALIENAREITQSARKRAN